MDNFILNLRGIWARAYVRIIAINREYSWLFFEVLFPLFPICAFAYMYKAMNAPSETLGFVLLGGTMISLWINVLWSMAAQFFWERETGNLVFYIMSPMNMICVLLGMALGSIISSILRIIIIFIIGKYLFSVTMNVNSYFWFSATFFLTMISVFCLGMALSSVFLMYGRNAWKIMNVFMEPVFFLSGFYFPVKALGYFLASAASFIPITLGLDAMRQLAFKIGPQSGLFPVSIELTLLVILSIIYFKTAQKFLDKFEYTARTEGRLTLRWQ